MGGDRARADRHHEHRVAAGSPAGERAGEGNQQEEHRVEEHRDREHVGRGGKRPDRPAFPEEAEQRSRDPVRRAAPQQAVSDHCRQCDGDADGPDEVPEGARGRFESREDPVRGRDPGGGERAGQDRAQGERQERMEAQDADRDRDEQGAEEDRGHGRGKDVTEPAPRSATGASRPAIAMPA